METPGDEYQVLYDAASDLLFNTDLAGQITRVNRAFERVLGLNRIDVVGSPVHNWVVPQHRERFREVMLERIGGAPALPIEVEMAGTTGPIPAEVTIELIFDAGTLVGLHGVARDITEQVRSRLDMAAANETLLRQTKQLATFSRYLQLLHRLSTTSYDTQAQMFADYLRTGCEIFNLECGAIARITEQGPRPAQLCGRQTEGLLERLVSRVVRSHTTMVGPIPEAETGSGSFYAGTPIVVSGEFFGALLFWSEDTSDTHPQAREMVEMMARGIEMAIQHHRLTGELEFRARHDSLTGIPNRQSFHECLDRQIAQARLGAGSVGVVFLDLDRFKDINDRLGHVAGDAALRQIAIRLSRVAEQEGFFIARVGGDEFAAIITADTAANNLLRAADRLLQVVAEPLELPDGTYCISCSLGVSLFPDDGEDETTLLSKADRAMYNGKRQGGNTVRSASALA